MNQVLESCIELWLHILFRVVETLFILPNVALVLSAIAAP